MGGFLKQNTSVTIKAGPFLDSTDGVTAETALTISQADVRVSKNGGDYAQKSDATAGVHDELGEYDIVFNATDTNTLGLLKYIIAESGAIPVWDTFMVVPANVWDSLFGADQLQVHVNEMTAGIITAAVIATGAIDADALAADTITAAKVAADVSAEIADAVWDEDATGHQTQGSFGQAIGDPVADTNTIFKAVVTDATGVTVGADTTEILTDTADMQPKLGTPANLGGGATIAANLSDIEAQTDDIGIAGAGLTALGDTRLANLDAAITTRATPAQVNAEVVDALDTDTYAEPGQGAPGATISLAQKISFLYKFLRNRVTSSGTTISVYADDGTTVDQKSTHSDNGSVYDRGEFVSGP